MNMQSVRQTAKLSTDDMACLMALSKSNYTRLEKGRRKPTIQQKRSIFIIDYLHRHGLLQDMLKTIREDNQTPLAS